MYMLTSSPFARKVINKILRTMRFDKLEFEFSEEEYNNVVQNLKYRLIAYWESFGKKCCVILAYVDEDNEIHQLKQQTCLFEERYLCANALIVAEIALIESGKA